MATERQILANRANAAKSTGPRTACGKKISAQNATVHGLASTTVVLKGESMRRFKDLAAALILQFQPRNSAEAFLVHTMTAARWRLLRLWGMQTAGFQFEMARKAQSNPGLGTGAVLAAVAFHSLADNSRALATQHRFEVSYSRQFNTALNALLKLRETSDAAPTYPAVQLDTETRESDFQNEPDFQPSSSRGSNS